MRRAPQASDGKSDDAIARELPSEMPRKSITEASIAGRGRES
jgi:hypothetical protein